MIVKKLQQTILNRRRERPPDERITLFTPSDSEKLPRKFGSFLLTTAFGEDALGHSYRAMSLGDSQDFVRLRILDSPDLPKTYVAETLRANNWYVGTLSGPHVVRGARMGSVLGVPFLAWTESHGWSLDRLLDGLRRAGRRLATAHALWIADGIASALESAQRTKLDRRPVLHGLVWPGFVSIGEDGDVRLGGFGVASAILPLIRQGTLGAGIAPYLAPEEREEEHLAANSDIYAVGALLFELATGRRPSEGEHRMQWRSEDAFPSELRRLLAFALGPRELRFATPTQLKRELAKVAASLGVELSSRALREDLRTLLAATPPPARVDPPAAPPADPDVDRALDDYFEKLNLSAPED